MTSHRPICLADEVKSPGVRWLAVVIYDYDLDFVSRLLPAAASGGQPFILSHCQANCIPVC